MQNNPGVNKNRQRYDPIECAIAFGVGLIKLIAPDFHDRPLYVIRKSELEETQLMRDAIAITGAALDIGLAPVLIKSHQWVGRGNAMLIDDDLMAAKHRDDYDALRTHVSAVILHESAHMLNIKTNEIPLASQPLREMSDTKIAAILELHTRPYQKTSGQKITHGHGPDFIRACCHLEHRTRQVGDHKTADAIPYAGPRYWLSHKSLYCRALADEVRQVPIDQPITPILRTPPPARFIELWNSERCEDN